MAYYIYLSSINGKVQKYLYSKRLGDLFTENLYFYHVGL